VSEGGKRGAWFALIVLFLINMVNFYDRQIIGVIAEPIRKEWGLSDKHMGALGTAFTLLYAAVGLPLGRMADYAKRTYVLAGGVFVWSLFTAACGITRGYWDLFAVRLGVGVGEASCAPAATSLIGDVFPAKKRGMALSIFMLGLPIGIALAFLVSGAVAQRYGWRQAFFVAGAPGLLLAVLALFVREPVRGGADARPHSDSKALESPYKTCLAIPTLWWIIASGALHNFNMYALGAFLSPLLQRHHGVSILNAGLISMVTYGLSGVPGLLIGGAVADAAMKRSLTGRMLVCAFSILLAAPLVYLAIGRPSGDTTSFLALLFCGCMLMYVYYSSVYATIQDVVEPKLRGTAMALYFFAMYVLGASLGPYGVGMLSDHFSLEAARKAGVYAESAATVPEQFRAAGIQSAMYVVPILALILAFTLFAGAMTVRKDIERLHERTRGEI
jgi:predicted MFS family arabinose efflux permease